MRAPFGTTVTFISRARAGVDADGNDVWTPTETTVTGVPVWERQSTEQTSGRDTVIVGLSILAPPGVVLLATDRVRIGDNTYEVDGEAVTLRSMFTGWQPGTQAALLRVTG